METAKLLESLNSESFVFEAQENQHFLGMTKTGLAYDDPLIDVQYGNHTTMVHLLHASSTGHDVRVGIIDSNVDVTHPDLQGQIAKSYHLVDNPSSKGLLHGTAVTGVIGAAAGNGLGVAGLAPGATLIVYGACGGNAAGTRCTSFALAKAFAHALDDNVSVLNVSLAGPRDSLLEQLIDEAIDRQIVLVAATNPDDKTRNFPANHHGVHAVGSANKLWFARGEQMTTQAGGGYRVFSGSSIAAAGMSGAAALLRSQYSAAETNRILQSLLATECASSTSDSPIPQLLAADGCS
jgi:subtilisin family serine protease